MYPFGGGSTSTQKEEGAKKIHFSFPTGGARPDLRITPNTYVLTKGALTGYRTPYPYAFYLERHEIS